MFVDALRAACIQRGMDPGEAEVAIGQYLLVGTLSARDRVFLEGLIEAGMRGQAILRIRERFGPAAAPAALVALESHIGGLPPTVRPRH